MLMLPLDLAGADIDRKQSRSRVEGRSATSAIAFGILGRVVEICDSVAFGAVEIEESGLGVITRGRPVRSAHSGHVDHGTIDFRLLGGIRNGLTFGVDAFCPVTGAGERLRDDVLAIGAIQNKEPAASRALSEQLARLSVNGGVEEYRGLDVVPIVGVVRRGLEPPRQFSSVRIQRNDGGGPEIGAFAALPREYGIRIAGAPVYQV